jgi:glycosyltransferase involved in cell wall biosynthesis
MKILLTALSSANGPDGVGRHAANVLRCLLHRPEVERVDLVIGVWQEESLLSLLTPPDSEMRVAKLRVHHASCTRSSLSRNLWHYRELPRLAKRAGSDLVHLTYPVPVRGSYLGCPMLVTMHDLYPYDLPENFGYPRVFMNRLILRQCLANAEAVACVSKTTLDRLRVRFPEHAEKATCIYNCVERTRSMPVGSMLAGPFVLVVAQHRKSKNIPLALTIFRRLLATHPELTLLVVGNEGPETSTIRRMLDDQLLRGHVVLFENINEQQLRWCYRNCELLLATSRIEGFGLPVVEAILAGCPVVCSDIPALREFGGELCHFVTLDSSAEQSFLEAVRKALGRRMQPVSLPHLSMPVIAAQYAQLYASLLYVRPVPMAIAQLLEQQTKGAA